MFIDDPKELGGGDIRGGELCVVGSKSVFTVDRGKTYKARFPSGKQVVEYSVGPIKVTIQGEPWPSYRWAPSAEFEAVNTVCARLAQSRLKVGSPANVLGQILQSLVKDASQQLVELGVDKWVEDTAHLCALSALGLTPIAPLFLDSEVEEIYLDRPGALCYIDHSEHGRLWYPYVVGKSTILRLGLYAELSVGSALSYSSNTVKGYLQVDRLSLRISVDSEPLAADGGSCVVRKLYHSKWSLDRLIRNGTISAEAAALLVGALRHGWSLLVCGLPRVGKTTLCNALLAHLPTQWRKIYIEDVLETRAPSVDDRVVRYSTDSAFNTDKLLEVTKSLHRSPDVVFVGELQTKQQTLAAAMLMAVGIPCIQTVHATSLEGLLNRWRNIYSMKMDISAPLLALFMESRDGHRAVSKIMSVRLSADEGPDALVVFEGGALNKGALSQSGLEEAYAEGVKALGLAELPA